MLLNSEGNICDPLYSYSDEQNQTILNTLKGSSDIEDFEKSY